MKWKKRMGKATGISLGDVALNVNGVRVEVRTDGSVLAYPNSGVDAYAARIGGPLVDIFDKLTECLDRTIAIWNRFNEWDTRNCSKDWGPTVPGR